MLLRPASLFLGCLILVGCGSRTGLRKGQGEAGRPECEEASDCNQSDLCNPRKCSKGVCVADEPVVCDGDAPACTELVCNPASGRCDVQPLTEDLDRDGFSVAISGRDVAPSCSQDCDDTNPSAYPGAQEVCDGVDNDCDGIIDNGAEYLAEIDEPLPISTGFSQAGLRGGDYGNGVYFVSFWGEDERKLGYTAGLFGDGSEVFPPQPQSEELGTTFGADIAWSGSAFGAIWSVNSPGNYEVYFGLFDSLGNKLREDVRVTNADDFSYDPRVLHDGDRFVAVFTDERSGTRQLFGQFILDSGDLDGGNKLLTGPMENAQSGVLALMEDRIGLGYLEFHRSGGNPVNSIRFRSFDEDLEETTRGDGPVILVDQDATRPKIVALEDRFIMTWDESFSDTTGRAIWGAVLDEDGSVIVDATPVTEIVSGGFARNSEILSLGDRFILLWAGDYEDDGATEYKLYAKVLGPEFEELEPRTEVVVQPGVTSASAMLGNDGKVGLIFNSYVDDGQAIYFMTLGCEQVEVDLR